MLPGVWPDVLLGESIAINGECMTVAAVGDDVAMARVSTVAEGRSEKTQVESPCHGGIAFDVIRESLDKTNLGQLCVGDAVKTSGHSVSALIGRAFCRAM